MRDYTRIEVSIFNDKKVSSTEICIKMKDPSAYSGISSIVWRPKGACETVTNWLTVGYFGGYIEHWDTDRCKIAF